MKSINHSVATSEYIQLLKKAYVSDLTDEDRKIMIITRAILLAGIVGTWIAALNFEQHRQALGGLILIIGSFLLTSSYKYHKRKQVAKSKAAPFEQMAYQLTEITKMTFELEEKTLVWHLFRKDGSQRTINFNLSQLSESKKMDHSLLISNQEGIDLIIPEGLLPKEALGYIYTFTFNK